MNALKAVMGSPMPLPVPLLLQIRPRFALNNPCFLWVDEATLRALERLHLVVSDQVDPVLVLLFPVAQIIAPW
jgi:hypothetical protein